MEQEQSINVYNNVISASIEGPSQCTSSGKRLTSMVWEHMTKLEPSKARCNYYPPYKLDIINFCYGKLFGEVYAKEMVAKVKNTLIELVEHYKETLGTLEYGGSNEVHGSTSASLSAPRTKRVSFDVPEDELVDFLTNKNRTNDKSELEAYLSEENESAKDEIDVLQFWKKKSGRAPTLAAMARDILTIPVTLVPSESAFSFVKKMITACRSSLACSTIEALACYGDWLRMKGSESGTSKC